MTAPWHLKWTAICTRSTCSRDNETVAGEQDLVRDHDLIRRTHTQGLLQAENRAGDEWESSIYVFEGKVNGDRNSAKSALNLTLRPHEALTWRWGHAMPVKYHGAQPPRFPDRLCNGLWEYQPDLTQPAWRDGASTVESIRDGADGLAAEEGKTGVVVWTIRAPYVFVGGRLDVEGTGAKFALSWDGKSWHEVDRNLDGLFPPEGPARYEYHLRCELTSDARLRRLAIVNDLQMAPLTLPGMGVGPNSFRYTDDTTGERRLQVTHRWLERSASRPPAAPAEPVYPPAGGEADGTAIVFQWRPAVDPDGHANADYHFELSARTDMKWPLSMSVAKLISRTPDAGQARYTLPSPGLLNPDTAYFWRVRAQDEAGVWGPWSPTWSFTPRGPYPPRDVALDVDRERPRGTLRWTPDPRGRKAVAYRVYASDEKGFSVSDQPYKVTVGVSDRLSPRFPANFVAETSDTALEVIGPEVELATANKAFYRVVAVDASGRRSGPSDYAASPRPVIVSAPVTLARVGTEYHYRLAAIRSLGDLRMRVVGGKETTGFWDVERPRFAIQRGPGWLTIDEATGLLSGVPVRAGSTEVVVSMTLQPRRSPPGRGRPGRGIEKGRFRAPSPPASATQRFPIVVSP